MKKLLVLITILLFAGMFSAAVSAGDQTVYKWTDAQGTVHYSDKPPAQAAPDLQTMDLPAFPPQDPAKIAAAQAALAASTAALQQQMLTQAALDQQAAELARERAELQAAQAAVQQDAEVQPAPMYAIYANSPFIPRSFHRNLYAPHRHSNHGPMSVDHPMVSRPPMRSPVKP